MANNALDDFVKAALDRGESRERILAALTQAGWSVREVEAALRAWAVSDFGLAVPRPRHYVSAREAFLYIVMFILLGVVAWHLGSLFFAFVDMAIPDELQQSDYAFYAREAQIRQGVSGLVVGTPLFVWVAAHIRGLRRTNPATQRSRVRKWLTYVTLIIAAATLIGDAMALVYNFLSGDLSTRLFLKLMIIAVIAGAIFLFFMSDAEREVEHEQKV